MVYTHGVDRGGSGTDGREMMAVVVGAAVAGRVATVVVVATVAVVAMIVATYVGLDGGKIASPLLLPPTHGAASEDIGLSSAHRPLVGSAILTSRWSPPH